MILDELYESSQSCPECGGPAFSDLILAEKKDACYNKVRSRYKVWPSAYASGALVQCRKKGAANWGNKSKNEGVAEDQLDEKCWDTHRQAGMKKKGDRMVPNCVPKEGVEEAQYDRGDYYDAHTAGEYGRDLSHNDDRRGHGASRSTERDGRDDHFSGQSANLPADPFGRTTGAVPKVGSGRIHNIALPGEIDEGDKIGNMDVDQFDAAMSRLKKLAGQGPLKTVWDPQKRVYRNVPVAVQPKQQPGK